MTRGAWMRRQHDGGLKYWFAPRENEKPFTESERAQRWRLSLASLLFITVLLSDHLWFCAEAKLTRTRDKRSDERRAVTGTGEHPNSPQRRRPPPPPHPHRLAGDAIFVGNSTSPLSRMDTCLPDSVSKDCFTFTDAETVCVGLSGAGENGTRLADVNLSDLYLSFCNSYSLLDLFYGFTSPGDMNCTLDMAKGEDLLGCSECVRAYQLLDEQAEDNYREFELMVQKYETDAYSVRTCMEECKAPTLKKCFSSHSHYGGVMSCFSAAWVLTGSGEEVKDYSMCSSIRFISPGCVLSTSRPPRCTAASESPVVSTAWRCSSGAPSSCPTMMISSMEAAPVLYAQGCCRTIHQVWIPMQSAAMCGGT
ncbi:NALCN channel auxiliary factor 1 isoform X2 [Betta splendens]|uniref:NALCN channel auxiliary factor 1 isoform X2 n=1 Tax=Betta splendens TaxID=158456 RepID=A0A9W2XGB2_BETSP|nr:NALCN channel auxiliary factor 1 isoform X2 [Betta splendens]